MRALLFLLASQSGITNIDGIQPAINLEYVDLSFNKFTNAAPLAALTNLQILVLDGDKISNLNFITNLPYLAQVSFEDTGIKDISLLAKKTNLTFLDLSYNLITNLSLITRLTNLNTLVLDGTGLQDISFLTNLPNLQTVSIANNNIQDLSPLTHLPILSSVNIAGNGIDLTTGSPNALVVNTLQSWAVYIPSLQQVFQPSILNVPNRSATGLFLQFTGAPGRWYNIQTSTNLVTWTNIGNLQSTSETTTFCDTNMPVNLTTTGQRFYRIQQAYGSANPIITLGNPVKGSNGVINLSVSADGIKNFVVMASTDLMNWTAISTNASINGNLLVPAATNSGPQQFFRLSFP
jgi:hypothetical protein